jgi:hypothetical protein
MQQSIIAPQLLRQVDELLATDRMEQTTDLTDGMGPWVHQAQGDNATRSTVHLLQDSDTQLNVTAIPLPNAFGMAALLLGILLLARMIRRYQPGVA